MEISIGKANKIDSFKTFKKNSALYWENDKELWKSEN